MADTPAAEMTVAKITIERRLTVDGDSYVRIAGHKDQSLNNVEALGMLEVAKALIVSDLLVEDD